MPAYDRPPAYAQPVLRILDARTGEPVPAAPARRGLTRIEAHACGLDPTVLRVLLTADVLVRALELGGTPVWAALAAPHHPDDLRTAATTLAIRPFEDAHDLASGLGEAQVIHVTAETPGSSGGGPVVWVAPVEWTGEPMSGRGVDAAGHAPEATSGSEPPAHPAFPILLSDPCAFRLALLSVPRGEPVRVDPGVLEEAAGRLGRWRRAVAGWARRPSRPVPDEVRGRLRSAWEDDLDLPGVLEVLRDVESAPDLPDGARFETYVYADRLLALDLARDLGSLV
ncbi:hypothetical protein SRB17_51300 [Streptomyces sp. RB17]|uniref:hypothetical protein n=1 Tax=Streptomyces sp. RB17 TaxID=2585197 RepID=UPI0012970CB4|nr:hypothetical protein [Streptomyces sp. RB17]MQY37126.1 hypothetical protein [Streptomyces sp. RB17]